MLHIHEAVCYSYITHSQLSQLEICLELNSSNNAMIDAQLSTEHLFNEFPLKFSINGKCNFD